MLTGRSISAHNRQCHLKKREAHQEVTTEKRGRLKRDDDDNDEENRDADNIQHFDVFDDNLQWIESRKSPYKQKREDSLLGKQETEATRPLFDNVEDATTASNKASTRDFKNPNSTAYFNADINGTGIADIVSLSQFGIMEVGGQIHPADVQFATDVAVFVHELTQAQRSDLAHILKGTVDKVKRDAKSERLWLTSVPTTPYHMRRQYWDGKNSFLDNIPYPTVESVGLHGYTSLRECIRNRLAFGFPLEKIEFRDESDTSAVRSLMQSRKCQRLLRDWKSEYTKEPTVFLFLKEWQDGYDPHSFSKSNRGSAWLKTCTIAEPHDDRNGSQVSESTFHGVQEIIFCGILTMSLLSLHIP